MRNCGATYNIHQKPMLPFCEPLARRQLKSVDPLPIDIKIKSYKLKDINISGSSAKKTSTRTSIQLPNFVHLHSSSLNVESERIITKSFDLVEQTDYLPKIPRFDAGNLAVASKFWWHWLLSATSAVLILVLPILFQSSSQADNLLDKAKVYLELDSQTAMSLPETGRTYLYNTQASPFNRAIEQAQKIEADSPFYSQAQADISRWSETILDIAQGRANNQDFAGAIAAAKLVPQAKAPAELVAQQATEAVENWQLRAQRCDLYADYLIKAKKIINYNHASSYNQAIGILRQITPGAKEYLEAQSLIKQWNKQIYLIVERRAAQGNFSGAMAAAALVPQDSPYYQAAKISMNIWKNQANVFRSSSSS